MGELKIGGATKIEDTAIRGWLEQQGVSTGRYDSTISEEKLEKAKIDLDGLKSAAEAAGHAGEITLSLLKKHGIVAGQRPDLQNAEAQLLAQTAASNQIKMCTTATKALGDFAHTLRTGGDLEKAGVAKLQSMARRLKFDTEKFTYAGEHLMHLDDQVLTDVKRAGQEVVDTHAEIARVVADYLAQEEVPAPTPSVTLLFEELRKEVANVDGWLRSFETKADLETQAGQKLRSRAIDLLAGGDEKWFEEHFDLSMQDFRNRPELMISSKKEVDLDLSGKGLQRLPIRGGLHPWKEHRGNIDLSNNELGTAWGLPEHIRGSLNLSNNAFTDMHGPQMSHKIIDGDLDLSNNRALRSIAELKAVKIGGDLNLSGCGVKSQFWGFDDWQIGGKLILDASQKDLASTAEHSGIEVLYVDPENLPKPIELPEDPKALVLDYRKSSQLAKQQFYQLVSALPYEELDPIAAQLYDTAKGTDEAARQATLVATRMSRTAEREIYGDLLDKMPENPGEGLPDEIKELPIWKLLGLRRAALRRDFDNDAFVKNPKGATYPDTGWDLRTTTDKLVVPILMERVRQGEVTSPFIIQHNWESETTFLDDPSADQAAEVAARLLSDTKRSKASCVLTIEGQGEMDAEDLFDRFKGHRSNYQALERVALRFPDNDAFWQLYEHLNAHVFCGDNVFVHHDDATTSALTAEHRAALQQPGLKAAVEAYRGIDANSTVEEARQAKKTILEQLPGMSEIEAGAVLHDLGTQDLWELCHADPAVRLELISVVPELMKRVDDDRIMRYTDRFLHALTDLFYNQPEVRDGVEQVFSDVTRANPLHWNRARQLDEYGKQLEKIDGGKEMVDKEIDHMLRGLKPDAAPEERDFSLKVVAWSTQYRGGLLSGRVESLLEQLDKLEGLSEEQEQQRDLVRAKWAPK